MKEFHIWVYARTRYGEEVRRRYIVLAETRSQAIKIAEKQATKESLQLIKGRESWAQR